MKKIFILTAVLLGFQQLNYSQVSVTEDNEIKNFRFGLQVGTSFDWLNSSNKKKLLNGGVGVGFDWGMQLEFRLANNFSFVSGLSLKTSSYKLDYVGAPEADAITYILDKNSELVEFNENGTFDTVNQRSFLMDKRSFKTNYINIPLILKMKTKEIGYLTYFGQFGANLAFATKSRANDSGRSLDTATNQYTVAYTNEDLNLSKSIVPIRAGLVVGGGAEYNFSGTTSMFFALHYNHFFTSYLKSNDKYSQKPDVINPGKYVSGGYKTLPGAITLTLGILF
jgi:hypothetical protein